MKNIFKIDQIIGVSKFRIYLLRLFYLMIIVLLGIDVWSEIFVHKELWQPLPGVAYSFWGAFTLLAILGLLHPLKMIPLLLVQFSYKIIWLIIVAYPLWAVGQLKGSSVEEMTIVMASGIVIDLIVIPWPYVLKNYFLLNKNK
ncbi:MAG: hypothetical protein EHM47_05495 [Ignavibacteriales bacterium]|nr:MAG: hypothetical protein EHM47_05495 [Ignavibacteriales bacterium]